MNAKALLLRILRKLRFFMLRAMAARGKRRWRTLIVGILAIVVWQYGFSAHDAKIDTTYTNRAASGVHNDQFFVYFFWYEGLFPVESTLQHDACGFRCPAKQESTAPGPNALSKEVADGYLHHSGNTLVMDSSWTWYAGDRGKIWLFMFDTWLKGVPYKPSVKPIHKLVFMIALSSLFAAFWRQRRTTLGALLVIFLGSNPFQIFEVHQHENVFSWTISTAIILLAIHLPLLRGKRMHPLWVFLYPIGAALMMATIRTVRSEPMPLVAAALFSYLFVRFKGHFTRKETWIRRGALIATFLAFVFIGHQIWARYWLFKHNEAVAAVTKAGGHPYPGNVRLYHHFWHPVWCGLGDFDKKKGYVWDDTKALDYARPILENKFHEYVPSPTFDNAPKTFDEFWDGPAGFYKKLPYDIPNYNEIIRDKILADVTSDPVWYAGILLKRIDRIFNEATPIRLSTRLGWLDVPLLGSKLFFPFLLFCLVVRARLATRLLLFTLPTITTPLIVFCDKGLQFYGVFHFVMSALLVGVLVEIGRRLYKIAKKRIQARRHAA